MSMLRMRRAWSRLVLFLANGFHRLRSPGTADLRLLLGIPVAALALSGGCGKNAAATSPATQAPMGTYADYGHDPGDAPPPRASADDGYHVDSVEAEADVDSTRMGTRADSSGRDFAASAAQRRAARHARRTETPPPTPTRPGLGTAYGERHHSTVVNTAFHRASSSPDVVLSLWYNDWEGIESMASAYGRRSTTNASATGGDGRFVISLIDEWGRTLPASDIDGRRYTAGNAGARYKIRITNSSAFRFEVVTSVDGLDVIDGDEAAYHKRGYILDPWQSITIDGWRTSDASVAAFRFSGIEDSYAERTGKGRNVGVVGVAFFHERGAAPWEDLNRRHSSDPFPGRYAPPPPPRWR